MKTVKILNQIKIKRARELLEIAREMLKECEED